MAPEPHPRAPPRPAAPLSAAAVLAGAVLARTWDRLPPWAFHPALMVATASVGVTVWIAGPGTAGFAIATPLLLAALYAGFCFSLAAAVGHGLFAMTVLSLVLARLGQPFAFEVILLAGVAGAIAAFSNADVGLVTSVRNWSALLPPDAALARLGGDEFVVVLPATGLADARRTIDQLRAVVPQPVRCSAGEALVRWQHPVEGLLGPAQFLPIAARSGAIHALGRWVLDETCRQLSEWRRTVPAARDLVGGINVSTTQLCGRSSSPTSARRFDATISPPRS